MRIGCDAHYRKPLPWRAGQQAHVGIEDIEGEYAAGRQMVADGSEQGRGFIRLTQMQQRVSGDENQRERWPRPKSRMSPSTSSTRAPAPTARRRAAACTADDRSSPVASWPIDAMGTMSCPVLRGRPHAGAPRATSLAVHTTIRRVDCVMDGLIFVMN